MGALTAYENTIRTIKKRRAECKNSKTGYHRFKKQGKKSSSFRRCLACHLEVSGG